MKTVVVGVFDQQTDAGRVIAQLAASPLDMDSVQVVHADTRVQERLSAEAGLPTRRAAVSFLVVGALLGAVIGFWAGGGFGAADAPALIGLGPLPTLTAGMLIGAALGLMAGVFGERTEIPPAHRAGLLEALGDGATVVAVRTENLPTARAIGDLFQAGGSRILEGALPPRTAAPPAGGGAANRWASRGARTEADAASAPEEHQAFVPPWRRAGGEAGTAVEISATADNEPSFTLFPEAGVSAAATGASFATSPSPSATVATSVASPATTTPPISTPPSPREIRHGDVLTGPDTSSRTVAFKEVEALPSAQGQRDGSGMPSNSHTSSVPYTGSIPGSLTDLGLPARVVRALEANRVSDTATLIRLVTEDPQSLDLIPGVGPMAQKQIWAALAAVGLQSESWSDEAPPST